MQQPQTPTQIPTRKAQLSAEVAWKQRLLAQYDISQEQATLLQTAENIAKLSMRRSEIVRELLPAVQQELDGIEAEALLDVVSQLDEKGKAVYGNAEARKAAVDRVIQQHPGAQATKAQRIELQRESDQYDAELDLEHRKYTAAKYGIEHKLGAIKVLGL